MQTRQEPFSVMVVGAPAVGKTALMEKYINHSRADYSDYYRAYRSNPDVRNWTKTETVGEDHIEVTYTEYPDHIGRDNYYYNDTVYPRAFTYSDAGIFVYDNEQSWSFLILEVNEFCKKNIKNGVIILAASKSDQSDDGDDGYYGREYILPSERRIKYFMERIKEQYPSVTILFYSVSAKRGKNVEALFQETIQRMYENRITQEKLSYSVRVKMKEKEDVSSYKEAIKTFVQGQLNRTKLGDDKRSKLNVVLNGLDKKETRELVTEEVNRIREITVAHNDTGMIGFFKATFLRKPTSYNAFNDTFDEHNQLKNKK